MKLTLLLKALDLKEYKQHISYPDINLTKGIIFADDNVLTLDPYALYIGTPYSITELIKRCPFDSDTYYTFISSGNSSQLSAYFDHGQINLIITKMPLIKLYNKLNQIYQKIVYTNYKMQSYSIEQRKTEQFLTLLSRSIHGCIFLLNSGYRLLCSECSLIREANTHFIPENETICCELLTNQYLPKQAADLLTEGLKSGNKQNIFLQPLRHHQNIIGYLLILYPSEYNNTIDDLIACYSLPYLSQSLVHPDESFRKIDSQHQFISDLLERRISTENELYERTKLTNFSTMDLYCCILIQTDIPSETTFSYMMYQIRNTFPRFIIDSYKNYILIILPAKQHAVIPTAAITPLGDFLNEYSAYAGVSFPVKSLFSLPAVFKEALDAIKLGKDFESTNKRLFYYEDYYLYSIIDMCNNENFKKYYNMNPGYLCHPAFIQLHRYDLNKNDNLSDILYHYLMNNQSFGKTASELYLHRNTVIKKIQKIEEIIHRSLNDALLCQALLFSFQVIKYSKTVLGKEIEFLDK